MPVTKTVLNDLGSVALKELVDAFNGQEVRTAPVGTDVITTGTDLPTILATDVDLVVTDVLIVNLEGAVLTNVATDIHIEHDTDLAFGSATIVFSCIECDVNNFPATLANASTVVAGDPLQTVQTFPFLLPAGAALRGRFINTEGANRHLQFSAKYHPADDLLSLVPNVETGKVLREVDRVG